MRTQEAITAPIMTSGDQPMCSAAAVDTPYASVVELRVELLGELTGWPILLLVLEDHLQP